MISSLNDAYWNKRYREARRVLKSGATVNTPAMSFSNNNNADSSEHS